MVDFFKKIFFKIKLSFTAKVKDFVLNQEFITQVYSSKLNHI
jgi:hypothetical protein